MPRKRNVDEEQVAMLKEGYQHQLDVLSERNTVAQLLEEALERRVSLVVQLDEEIRESREALKEADRKLVEVCGRDRAAVLTGQETADLPKIPRPRRKRAGGTRKSKADKAVKPTDTTASGSDDTVALRVPRDVQQEGKKEAAS